MFESIAVYLDIHPALAYVLWAFITGAIAWWVYYTPASTSTFNNRLDLGEASDW